MVLGIVILSVFILIGLCIAVFARKIARWWGGQLQAIFRTTGFDQKLPWTRGYWPFGFEFVVVFLRVIGILLTLGAVYIFSFVLFR